MKKLIVIPVFLLGILNLVSAQDIIIFKNGEEIKAKVTEVESIEIKYLKFDNQIGPVYTVNKADVFMIKYENGTKDVFDYKPVTTAISPTQNESKTLQSGNEELSYFRGKVMKGKQQLKPYEVKATMNNNYNALRRYKGGRAFNTLGIIFTVVGCIDITTGIINTFQANDALNNFLAGGLEIGVGLIFNSVSKNKTLSSVVIYNSGLKKHQSTSLNLGITHSGLGLCLNF
jgi:hypothetical protein